MNCVTEDLLVKIFLFLVVESIVLALLVIKEISAMRSLLEQQATKWVTGEQHG